MRDGAPADALRRAPHQGGAGLTRALVAALLCASVAQAASDFRATPGVTVERLTRAPAGCFLSYHDIRCATADRLIANEPGPGDTWRAVTLSHAGTDRRVLTEREPPSPAARRIDVSPDGALATYPRVNTAPEAGWDLYARRLDAPARELRLTRRRFPEARHVKTSPATRDPRTGAYRVAFSIEHRLYVCDGTALTEIPLTDPAAREPFHRIRLNPKFPHLILYRRNAGGGPEGTDRPSDMWLVDTSATPPRCIRWYAGGRGPHPTWTPDGRTIAAASEGILREYDVCDAVGRPVPPATIRPRTVGPFGRGQPAGPCFFPTYSPDGRWIAVATDPVRDRGGRIWLVNRGTGALRLLCHALSYGPENDGQPRLGFVGENALLFSTDASQGAAEPAPPQLHLLRWR